jgi:hypothetical protein
MPRRKPKPEKIVQENIKNTLDQILMDESLDEGSFSPSDLPRMKTTDIMDFGTAKSEVGSDARLLMGSIVDFYLKENLIEKSDYIVYKQKIDAMNISSMMLQLRTAQHAITKLLEEIDLGNGNPRMFEVLAQLQAQIMQMPKDYQAYMNKMEESYIRLRTEGERKAYAGGIQMEYDSENKTSSLGNSFTSTPSQSEGIKVRGTRGLMEGLRDILGTEIEDIKVDESNENSIVNARRKEELSITRNDIEVDSENSLEIDEDLFN